MKTKAFDSLAVAGAYSGKLLVEGGFDDIHEVAEWVMGHPIWTHEFADPKVCDRLRFVLGNLFPVLETIDFAGITRENVAERVEQIRSALPPTFDVPQGAAERTGE